MDIILYLTKGIKPFIKGETVTNWNGIKTVFDEVYLYIKQNYKLIETRKLVAPKTNEYRGNIKLEKTLDGKRDLVWAIFTEGIKGIESSKMLYLFYISIVPVVCKVLQDYEEKRGSTLLDIKLFVECPFCLKTVDLMLTGKGSKIVENIRVGKLPLFGIDSFTCSCGKTFNIADDTL